MARIVTGLGRTTELEAVNEMLSVIGESPVDQTEIEAPTLADVERAVAILKSVTREVLSRGWKFNREFGYELAPADTYAWTGTDGSSATLNIFTVPATLLDFDLTSTSKQIGLDIEPRPPVDYSAAEGTLVMYDRAKNRDGLDSDDFDYLYIDALWMLDFEDLPEIARYYITLRAARRFQKHVVGDPNLDVFTREDELIALREMKAEYGRDDHYNIFRNAGTSRHLGGFYRRTGPSGFIDTRNSPRD